MTSSAARVGSALSGAGAVFLLLALTAPPTYAQRDRTTPSIVVSGHATADVRPDRATLTVGVEAEGPTSGAASAEVAKRAQAVLDRIKAEGVEARDITTSTLALVPVYADPAPKSGPQAPRAFRAETGFTFVVSPADRVGLVAAHLADGGASTIEGIAFSASDQSQRLDELRAAAVGDARHKGEIYAAALGLKLGDVLEVTPDGEDGQTPVFARATKVMSSAAIPVEPGMLSLQTGVSVRWRLAP